jgi:drug/metabolite transporter (DMT)-like permease
VNWSTGGGLLAIVLWSATFAFARSLSESVGPLTAAAAVYLVGGLLCLAGLRWSRTSAGHLLSLPRRYLLGCGSLFIVYTVAVYLAVGLARDRSQLLEIALVNYLWPTLTILLSIPLLRQRAGLLLLPGTALALTGVFLVMTQGDRVTWQSCWSHVRGNPAAYGLALVAAVAWALYSNLTRRWSEPGSRGAVALFMPATGLVLLVMRSLATEPASWSLQAAGEALALGGITALAYALWDASMRKGNLLLVAACSYFTPLLSTLVSCAYLRVTPTSRLWTGCLLIVAGSLATWWSMTAGPLGDTPPPATRRCEPPSAMP